MAKAAIRIVNLTSLQRAVSLDLGLKRQIQRVVPANGFVEVSDVADLDELSRLQAQLGSNFRVDVVPGTSDFPGVNDGIYNLNNGAGGYFQLTIACPASGATGTADDVTISAAGLGFAYYLADVIVYTSTAGAGGSTGTLRSAAGGGGSAFSSAITTAAQGQARTAGVAGGLQLMANNQALFLRRVDRSHVGHCMLLGIRTSTA